MKFFSLLVLIPIISFADNCPVDRLVPFTLGNDAVDSLVHIEADSGDATKKIINLYGNVIVSKDQEKVRSSKVSYNRQNSSLQSDGNLTYGNPDFALTSKKSNFNIDKKRGKFEMVDYYISDGEFIGSAEKLSVDRIKNIEDLEQATFSTCARENPSWHLKSKKLHLDHESEVGQSWGNTFYIKDTPVLYLPYLSFPLTDKRKTGFLFPSGNLSEGRGVDITTPYYINIAPNQDLTLYPRFMTKRGFMLGSEYRYLLPTLNGTISSNYITNDHKAGESNRWSLHTQHTYKPVDGLSFDLLYQRVSDPDYIRDFTSTLDLSSASFLESHLNMNLKVSDNYKVFAQIQDFQVANSNYSEKSKPYSRLPRVSGIGEWFLNDNFSFSSKTELTNFQKEDVVSGIRLDQDLVFSYYAENSFAYINPKAGYRFTYYDLENQAKGKRDVISRSIPNFSIDTGLYFDKQINWFGNESTQTLEPRLFYLYTPYVDQSDIPDFDTSRVDSSYDWLFLRNRFNGKDRVGDANQLTTALSTVITSNETGKELAKFSIGQIQYFTDRKVSLLDSVAKKSRSNLIAEGSLNISDKYKIRGLIHQDIDINKTEKSMLGLQYSPSEGTVLGLTYLYDKNYYEQVDFAGVWKINDYWRTFWRLNYSLRYDEPIDIMAGIEYSDCCWSVRLLARDHRTGFFKENKDEIASETAVYLEFNLKGLGKIGNDTTSLLDQIIPGYDF